MVILAPQNCGCPLKDNYVSIVDSPVCPGIYLFMILIESYIKGRCAIATPCSRVDAVKDPEEIYDFIVVGAGTAGSIVAGRLSENKNNKVLLIEAGPDEPIGARVPGFFLVFWGNKIVDWRFRTVPTAEYCQDQGDKGCEWIRGKSVGGSNMLNGLVYLRGHPRDYETWVKLGAKGWSWEDNKPFFDRTEGNKQIGTLVSDKYHSATGPLPVERFPYQPELGRDILTGINSTGLPVINDLNDLTTPVGFTFVQAATFNGQRYTTARIFLKPTSERPNFNLKHNAYVTRVLTEKSNGGIRATGIEYIDKEGNKKIVKARKEVILSAGTHKTPHILMISGIGPSETLKKFNIPVVADLPVGKNLISQYGAVINFILKKVENVQKLNWNVFTQYILDERGPLSATGLGQLTGLLYSSFATKGQPDLQIYFGNSLPDCSRTGAIGEPAGPCPEEGQAFSMNAVNILPKSVGYVTINSSDPLVQPLFYPGFFTHPDDLKRIKEGLDYIRRISESKILKEKYGIELNATAIEPCAKSGAIWSSPWKECIARLHTDPQNHQVGTAAIGRVINPRLQVYGIKGLRVADAACMPEQVSASPQAAVMMIGERAAQFIKDDWK